MATKKSLSDLLRQEVNPAEVPGIAAPKEPPNPTLPIPQASPNTDNSAELTEKLIAAQTQIADLTQALTSEKSQVSQLQKQLTAQTAIAATLTTDFKKAEAQEKELLIARQKVQELGQQLEALKPIQTELVEQKNLVNQLNETLQNLEKNQTFGNNQTAIAHYEFSPLALLSRPIGPNNLSTELSDEDIGWFD
ncbi:MAG: hypothetical protein ACRC6M_18615 [Microcystaceae cyanobacterium]